MVCRWNFIRSTANRDGSIRKYTYFVTLSSIHAKSYNRFRLARRCMGNVTLALLEKRDSRGKNSRQHPIIMELWCARTISIVNRASANTLSYRNAIELCLRVLRSSYQNEMKTHSVHGCRHRRCLFMYFPSSKIHKRIKGARSSHIRIRYHLHL